MKFPSTLLMLFIAAASLQAATFHVDPTHGSNTTGDGSLTAPWQTLAHLFDQQLIESHAYQTPYNPSAQSAIIKNQGAPIQEGDTILLYSGLHGEIFIQNYINHRPITIMGAEGHHPVLKKVHIQAGKNWNISRVHFSSEPYGEYINDKFLFLESHGWQGPVDNIVIRNNYFFSTQTPWLTATEWVSQVSDGILVQADSILVENNKAENIRFGISLQGDHNVARGNEVVNFSGDAMRVLGSYNLVDNNTIKNCYKVDDNHDDGIQSFTTGNLVVDHNVVINNTIINYEDPNQPLRGDLQGIGCYDGPYRNWTISNNVVAVNHWHGISMYGAVDCQIVNNTVTDTDLSDAVGPTWILVDNDGTITSSGCVIKNNISNALSINPNIDITKSHNLLVLDEASYAAHFIDHHSYDFQLKETSTAIDMADDSYAPTTDKLGNLRPQGPHSDIGAFEWLSTSHTDDLNLQNLAAHPNPTSGLVNLKGLKTDQVYHIVDMHGHIIQSGVVSTDHPQLDLQELHSGIFLIYLVQQKAQIKVVKR